MVAYGTGGLILKSRTIAHTPS